MSALEDTARAVFPHPLEERYRQLYVVANCKPRRVAWYVKQWPELYLTKATPQVAQQIAAALVDDYRRGIDFSAIDKEAIKRAMRDDLSRAEVAE